MTDWTKCNTYGSTLGTHDPSIREGLFKNNLDECNGCFAANLGVSTPLYAEAMGVILTVEIAFNNNWNYLWIECDSMLVTFAFNSTNIIPTKLRSRWNNCLVKLKNMIFFISRIYQEGNHCRNALTNIGLTLDDFTC